MSERQIDINIINLAKDYNEMLINDIHNLISKSRSSDEAEYLKGYKQGLEQGSVLLDYITNENSFLYPYKKHDEEK